MNKVLKYILLLNLCLVAASTIGSAWVSRSVGSQAYVAGAAAAVVVGIAGSIALVLTYLYCRQSDSSTSSSSSAGSSNVTGILLAMLVRMGLPLLVVMLLMQTKHPLMQAGFFGLLTINYLVALPIETLLSLQFINPSKPTNPTGQCDSGRLSESGLNGSSS
ncbi:MAG: hypothetical protein AAGD11_17895 [Planctomycetota bacterium]